MDALILARNLARFGLGREAEEALQQMSEAQKRHVEEARRVRAELLQETRDEDEEITVIRKRRVPHSSKMESK